MAIAAEKTEEKPKQKAWYQIKIEALEEELAGLKKDSCPAEWKECGPEGHLDARKTSETKDPWSYTEQLNFWDSTGYGGALVERSIAIVTRAFSSPNIVVPPFHPHNILEVTVRVIGAKPD